MIASLQGVLREKKPTEVLLEVGGIGYLVNIPLSTFEKLGEPGTSAHLLTHMIVREDALQLYGFASGEERETFRLLMSVTGIGPKMAQGILSGIGVTDLHDAIARGDLSALTAIPGVGKKLAERLVVELRDKLGKVAAAASLSDAHTPATSGNREEAVLALVSLGYNRPAAERAVALAIKTDPQCSNTLQSLIKAAIHPSR